MRSRLVMPFAIVATLCFAACHKSGSDSHQDIPPSQQIAQISGTYKGSYTLPGNVNPDLTVVINQSGASLSGTVTGYGGLVKGTIVGSVATDSFTLTMNQTAPCVGTLTLLGKVNANVLSGTYSGSDCNGPGSGTFTVTKQ